MHIFPPIFSVLLFLFNTFFEISSSSSDSAIFLSAVFRHGTRAPNPDYLMDGYKNSSYWPEGWGELTNIGKLEMYEWGLWLRSRYNQILGDVYKSEHIRIVSSDIDRTFMTAQCALAAIYPPKNEEIWNKNLLWQPVPIHMIHSSYDNLITGRAECPNLKKEKEKIDRFMLMKKYRAFANHLASLAGFPVESVTEMYELFENLERLILRNITLPDWTKTVFPQPMKNVIEMNLHNNKMSATYKRLSPGGPLLKDILSNMFAASHSSHPAHLKVKFYSAHADTLMDLLDLIGVYDQIPAIIPQAGTVILKLVIKNEEHNVNVLYKNSTGAAYPLIIPGCEINCTLNKFQSLMEPFLPQDWTTECYQ